MMWLASLNFFILCIIRSSHCANVSDIASIQKNLTNTLEELKNQSQMLIKVRNDILKHINQFILDLEKMRLKGNSRLKQDSKYEPIKFIKPKPIINFNLDPDKILLQLQKQVLHQLAAAKKEKETVKMAMYYSIYKIDFRIPVKDKKKRENNRFKRKSELKTIEMEYDSAIKYLTEMNDKISNVSNMIRAKRETPTFEELLRIILKFLESIGKSVIEVNFSVNIKDLNLKIKPGI